ncbi:MAG: metallophosphoesterase [Tannerella sp.]|jgi:predicted phosphodiesterase|nr:metallophosphoesterase [Tannerella sp.]
MKKFILLLLLIATPALCRAQERFEIICGPYLQNVTENEATVTWITNRRGIAWVEIAPDNKNHFYSDEHPRFYAADLGRKTVGRVHTVKITGLQKGTRYRYRIFSQETTDEQQFYMGYGRTVASDVYQREPFYFKTKDSGVSDFHFAVVNDIHNDYNRLDSLIGRVDKKTLDFVIFNGDMVNQMLSEEVIIDGFLKTAVKSFASEIPFYYARGNHETRGLFSSEFMRYFSTPTGLPYYTLQYGPVFFVFIDSGEDKPDGDVEYYGLGAYDEYRKKEAEWLKEVLQSEDFKKAPVKIAIMHIPPDNDTWHGGYEVRRLFLPLLNEAGIDLMLSGHTHQHAYIPKGEDICNFPLLINSNKHIVDIQINGRKISINIKTVDGKIFKKIDL